MILKSIKIRNFRNYSKLDLELNDKINIIYGNNGQGKTNILESIYVLALTKSHRSFIDNTLIKDGCDKAVIKGILNKDINYDLEIVLNKTKKTVKVDKKHETKLSDYIEKMNVIIFSSEDLYLIKGSPSERRKYINLQLSQLSSNYYNALSDFNKLLKIRNESLKKMANNEDVDLNYFDILTDYLINKSVFIYQMRNKYIKKLNEVCPNIFKKLSKKNNFKLLYVPSIEFSSFETEIIKEELTKKLKLNREKEIMAKTTLYGPHRDDFLFYLGDYNLKNFGSQGQQKLAVMTLKLSEIDIFTDYKKTTPIILLDDVFSDLDINKKNNLMKQINKDMQIVITTTDLDSIDKKLLKDSKLIHISNGKILKEKVIK